MSENKFTPGLWSVQPCAATHGAETVIGTEGGFEIARIRSAAWNKKARFKKEEKRDSANAVLIAAAPRMLEALQGAVNAWPDIGSDLPIDGAECVDWLSEWLHEIRIILLDAKGGADVK